VRNKLETKKPRSREDSGESATSGASRHHAKIDIGILKLDQSPATSRTRITSRLDSGAPNNYLT